MSFHCTLRKELTILSRLEPFANNVFRFWTSIIWGVSYSMVYPSIESLTWNSMHEDFVLELGVICSYSIVLRAPCGVSKLWLIRSKRCYFTFSNPTYWIADQLHTCNIHWCNTYTNATLKRVIEFQNTRRPASTGIFFAQLQIFWSTFAKGYKQNYCFDISFRRVFSNINSSSDFCTLCKSRFSVEKFLPHSAENFVEEPFCVSENLWYRKMLGIREGAGITICFVSQYRKTS